MHSEYQFVTNSFFNMSNSECLECPIRSSSKYSVGTACSSHIFPFAARPRARKVPRRTTTAPNKSKREWKFLNSWIDKVDWICLKKKKNECSTENLAFFALLLLPWFHPVFKLAGGLICNYWFLLSIPLIHECHNCPPYHHTSPFS